MRNVIDARSPAWLTPLVVFALTTFLLAGCGVKDTIEDFRTTTENALDDAIDALNNTSADLQQVLRELQETLPAEVQSTVRVEVANVASRSIAQAGVELRCEVDFVRRRVSQGLERIKAEFLGRSVPPIEPSICQVVPLAVERVLVPGRIPQLEFYGYDFDQAGDLKVFHERSNGRQDVTNELDRPTHYAMTLKFGATGVQLNNRSERFSLEWSGRTISTIAIIQPQTPVCRTRSERFSPTPVTHTPRHTRGDRDFSGHGPTIETSARLFTSQTQIRGRVCMKAFESKSDNSPKSDFTTAQECKFFPLYNPPSGFRIDRVIGPSETTHKYRDNDHTNDSFDMGSGGPVRRFDYVGDIGGDEAGTDTQVNVAFNRLTIELVETGNCVTERTLMSLHEMNLLQDATFRRLENSILEEGARRNLIIDVTPDAANNQP